MIPKYSIETKDFFYDLDITLCKIKAVSDAIYSGICEGSEINERTMKGWYRILNDIVDDIDVINKALYPSEISPEPDTTPISAEEG